MTLSGSHKNTVVDDIKVKTRIYPKSSTVYHSLSLPYFLSIGEVNEIHGIRITWKNHSLAKYWHQQVTVYHQL